MISKNVSAIASNTRHPGWGRVSGSCSVLHLEYFNPGFRAGEGGGVLDKEAMASGEELNHSIGTDGGKGLAAPSEGIGFQGNPPRPNRLDLLPELLSVRSAIPLPRTPDEWPEIRRSALESLPFPKDREEGFLALEKVWCQDERFYTRHCGAVGGVRVGIETRCRTNATKLLLTVVGSGEKIISGLSRVGEAGKFGSFGGFESRLSQVNPPDHPGTSPPAGAHFPGARVAQMRWMILTGQTPVTMGVEDIQLAVDHMLGLEQFQGVSLYLHGKGESAVAVLYAALLDERVAGVLLEDLPATHAEAGPIPGILRHLEMPHAVGLMAPRRTALLSAGHNNWTWPTRVFSRLGCGENFVMSEDRAAAIQFLLG